MKIQQIHCLENVNALLNNVIITFIFVTVWFLSR